MFTKVKTPAEITAMRQSGKLLATVLATLKEAVQPGMTTKDLSEIAKRELRGTGGQPAFLGQYGFQDVLCVSVNDEVVHGIPSDQLVIRQGDLVSMDFGVTYEGMITDSAATVIVGKEMNPRELQLVRDTEAALKAGIAVIRHRVKIGDIASAIQEVLDKGKYGIVRDLVGHGVGHELHEDPNIPNYGKAGTGLELAAGMTIAIEPMATLGTHKVFVDDDGWTVKTIDGSRAAHFEHTVLVTETSAEILTRL
jgi:methionyl aminopeptidase